MADDELERFKCDISLVDFAQAEYGYELDKKESSGAYFVLRSGNEKIVVTRDKEDGHDVYFNTSGGDKGSIIDFVKNRVGDNNIKLVRVRQALRSWAPGAKKPAVKKPAAAPQRPIATPKDRAAVVSAWKAMAPYEGSYLTQTRKLDPAIIRAFDVRQDQYGNACFKHLKPGQGVTGFEKKNAPLPGQTKTFTGFSEGGDKALMVGRLDSLPVTRLVIVEAAIDALSYTQMHHRPGTLYVSTGGSWSDEQAQQLKELIVANPKAVLVLATDNDLTDKHGQALVFDDRPGEKMAKRVAGMAPQGMSIERHTPSAKDWNKDLTNAAEAQAAQAQEVARVRLLAQQHDHEIARQRGEGMGM